MPTGSTTSCPGCGRDGRPVGSSTLDNLVEPEARRLLGASARFCSAESCDVAYYDCAGAVVRTEAVVVPIFQKETDPERLVCYCFEHSVGAVEAAQRDDGSNSIVEAITAACRSGLDRCEETNPQGRCCLGNVRAVAKVPDRSSCCDDGA